MTIARLLMVSIVAGAASLLADGGSEAARSPIGAPAWKDRRPIGRIFLSSSGWRTTNNPSGYLNAKEDVITPEGRKRLREDLLAYAVRCIANLNAMNAQGVVVIWKAMNSRAWSMWVILASSPSFHPGWTRWRMTFSRNS